MSAAAPIREPITLSDMPREQGTVPESLARLQRIYAELEQDIARAVSEAAAQRDPDESKRTVSRRVLAMFGYGEP